MLSGMHSAYRQLEKIIMSNSILAIPSPAEYKAAMSKYRGYAESYDPTVRAAAITGLVDAAIASADSGDVNAYLDWSKSQRDANSGRDSMLVVRVLGKVFPTVEKGKRLSVKANTKALAKLTAERTVDGVTAPSWHFTLAAAFAADTTDAVKRSADAAAKKAEKAARGVFAGLEDAVLALRKKDLSEADITNALPAAFKFAAEQMSK